MSADERSPDVEGTWDHVVVGAGLSGLAYAWRRRAEGRRVLVLEREADLASTPPALVVGAAPYLERLLDAVPGAAALVPWSLGPLHVWTATGLRPPDTTLGRLARRPGAWTRIVRERLVGRTPRDAGLQRVLPGGAGALRRALAAGLGDALRTGRTATRVRPAAPAGGLARVETDDGVVASFEVALAVAADEQARLLERDAPHRADVLRVVPHEDEVRLVLSLPPRRLPEIAGFERRPDARGRVREASFLSRLEPDAYPDGTVEAVLPRAVVPSASPETLARIARVDLERALGQRLEVRVVASRTARRARPAPGHRGRMAALAADLGGRGVRLLGEAALGGGLDRLASAGVPVAGPLPAGATVA